MSILTKKELHALMFARAGKPPSRALPKQAYFDPSASALFPAERAAREAAKKKRKQNQR